MLVVASANSVPDGSLLAAIDLGSNSFHLIVARLEHGEIKPVHMLGERVQLGAGLERGRLAPDAMDRGLDCLARFAQLLESMDLAGVRVGVSGATMIFVSGTSNPYFTWNRSLTDSGFDVGSSSNFDFKFTKKGIYFVGFSATFGHVTTNSSRYVVATIRGSGSTSESTNELARGIDQIAQVDTGNYDYGNIYVSLVKEFNVNDLINFYTDSGGPAVDAIRWKDTHVTIYMVRPL